MRMKRHVLALALLSLATPATVWATNGYFSHGYGMKSKGRAGVSTAMLDDAFGGAANPAKAAFVGNRLDLGVDLFSPRRSMERFHITDPAIIGILPPGSSPMSAAPASSDSEDKYFLIPEFGFNKQIRPDLAVGITVFGNGGMNTDYPTRISCNFSPMGGPVFTGNVMCGQGDVGVDMMQLMLAPTVAYKVNEQHALGISPLFAVQRFSAYGLQMFQAMSASPNNLTDQGNDYSTGWGVRVGWLGKLSDSVTAGASYASKMRMSRFDKYSGLFAEQGDFDIPSNWNLGLAIQATPQLMVALDYQRINYQDVKSVSNPSTGLGGPLGATNGPGFGWRDIDVWKLGVEYAYSKNLVLRAGWNHGDSPIQAADVGFNILAPGVIKDHATLGFTYTLANGSELTMAYMHAFENSLCGPCSGITSQFGGGERIKMHQNAIGVSYSWKL